MARDDPHFRLRIPAELKSHIAASAKANGRTLNAEIVHCLEDAPRLDRKVRALELNVRLKTEEIDRLKAEAASVDPMATVTRDYLVIVHTLLKQAKEDHPGDIDRLLQQLEELTAPKPGDR